MNKKKEPTYNDLKKYLTDEEIAESYILRSTLTKKEKEEVEGEFRKLRMERLQAMSDEQVLQSEIMRMKLLMKEYFQQDTFVEIFSFANQLKKYIALLKMPNAQFAEDINIHKTKLSRLINSKENPNVELMYRLEVHSGKMIPANYWFKLHARKLEKEIKSDQEKRTLEAQRVKNELNFKLSA